MEQVLCEELIPQYQRAVVAAFPDIAQSGRDADARRNGQPDFGRGNMMAPVAVLGQLVGGGERPAPTRSCRWSIPSRGRGQPGPVRRQGPDDATGPTFISATGTTRRWHFSTSRARWASSAGLWRSFTCGYLKQLLDKSTRTQSPFVIHRRPRDRRRQAESRQHFTFLAVAYWKKPGEFAAPAVPEPDRETTRWPTPRCGFRSAAAAGIRGGRGSSGREAVRASASAACPGHPASAGTPPARPSGGQGRRAKTPLRRDLMASVARQLAPVDLGTVAISILQTTPALPASPARNVVAPFCAEFDEHRKGRVPRYCRLVSA